MRQGRYLGVIVPLLTGCSALRSLFAVSDMNNPAAFPVTTGSDGGCLNAGMTLRDYFAAKAMQAYIGSSEAIHAIDKIWPDEIDKRVCIAAYRFADAMLKEREQ